MFSPMKLIVLAVVIGGVWFAFKAIGRMRQAKANNDAVDYEERSDIDDKR